MTHQCWVMVCQLCSQYVSLPANGLAGILSVWMPWQVWSYSIELCVVVGLCSWDGGELFYSENNGELFYYSESGDEPRVMKSCLIWRMVMKSSPQGMTVWCSTPRTFCCKTLKERRVCQPVSSGRRLPFLVYQTSEIFPTVCDVHQIHYFWSCNKCSSYVWKIPIWASNCGFFTLHQRCAKLWT